MGKLHDARGRVSRNTTFIPNKTKITATKFEQKSYHESKLSTANDLNKQEMWRISLNIKVLGADTADKMYKKCVYI